jgi:hypothetical protein
MHYLVIAQLEERWTVVPLVGGSNPSREIYFSYNLIIPRGCSSHGRASALHAEGKGIDALLLHYLQDVMAEWSKALVLGTSLRAWVRIPLTSISKTEKLKNAKTQKLKNSKTNIFP